MTAIVGCITASSPKQAQVDVRRMLHALGRGDGCEIDGWADERLGLYLAWITRNKSLDSPMPVENEDGSVVLMFSGEEYSRAQVLESLKTKGHQLEGHGRSYLVHLYEEQPSFPEQLNGRFHGVLVDRHRGEVMLFNDRYGMHRLYYYQTADTFYFAAEAKANLAVKPELRSLDFQSVGEFLAYGCALEDRSLFKNVNCLPGGSRWVFRAGRLQQKGRYFHPQQWQNQEILQPELYYQQLRDVFSQSVPRYFEDSKRIGVSLTGGLDTRMVLAWQRCEPGSLPCYTFGGMRRESEDVLVAREVARVCQQPYSIIGIGPEFLSRFSTYAERAVFLTDGSADVSRAPDLWLSERAREIAPIRMTGLYGGEILRNVRAFKPEPITESIFASELVKEINRAGQTYQDLANDHPVTFAAFKQAPWSQLGVLSLEQTQYSVRTPFLDNDVVQTAYRASESVRSDAKLCARLIADGNPALADLPTDRGTTKRGGPVQFAHRALLELLFKAEYAFDIGMPQRMARLDHSLSSLHLERLFLGRHKIFHFRTWYRDELSGFVRDMLLDSRSLSRPYVSRASVEDMVGRHIGGTGNYTREIHKLLTLEMVNRLFVDCSGRGDLREEEPLFRNLRSYCGVA